MYREQTISQFLDNTKLELLLEGGVENWDGYDDALRPYSEFVNEYKNSHPTGSSVEILYALEEGGVDNWEWYGEALKGFAQYSDYVEDARDLSSVLPFHQWKDELARRLRDAQQARISAEEEPQALTFSGEAEQEFFDYIAREYGVENAERIFLDAKKNGFWTGVVSPNSYTEARKLIRKGVTNPMEFARAKYLELIIKNGSLDAFLKSIQ